MIGVEFPEPLQGGQRGLLLAEVALRDRPYVERPDAGRISLQLSVGLGQRILQPTGFQGLPGAGRAVRTRRRRIQDFRAPGRKRPSLRRCADDWW